MKKFFFIAALASLTLVSCVKDEPAASVDAQHEIAFMAAPITKGPFQTTNVFESWAFYTPSNWATDKATAVVYGNLGDVLIEYDDDDPTSDYYQKWWNVSGGEHFYWPKAGKLTFFSYSLNSHLTNNDVKCSREKGIYVEDYNVNTKQNVDFLVADIAPDLNAGTVPTVFRHKLSKVAFTIETTANYTTKAFKLQSITLNNLAAEADYQQLGTEGWSGHGANVATTTFYNTPDLSFNNTAVTPDPVQYLYMPQEWDGDETVTIVYTVTSGGATENVSITKDLDEIFTAGWEMGKKYTCAIMIGLQEILWAPSVEEWTGGTAADFNIN